MLCLSGKWGHWSTGGEGKGRGGLLEITVGECSMLPESLTLPQTKIRNLPSLMSAFKRRVIERNIPYSRALIHNGQAYSVYPPKKGQKASHPLYNLSRSILQYIAYIRRYHFPWSNRTVRNKDMYTLSSRERKNSSDRRHFESQRMPPTLLFQAIVLSCQSN